MAIEAYSNTIKNNMDWSKNSDLTEAKRSKLEFKTLESIDEKQRLQAFQDSRELIFSIAAVFNDLLGFRCPRYNAVTTHRKVRVRYPGNRNPKGTIIVWAAQKYSR